MFFVQEHFARKKADKTAIFSEDRVYRFGLGRTWDWDQPRLYVCMVNPSTADGEGDDPTVSRLIDFATTWGYGGLGIVNLFALVSSDPKVLDTHPEPVGSGNQAMLVYSMKQAKSGGRPLLAAWGNNGSRHGLDRQFIMTARRLGVDLVCLGMTQHGHPKHPLARGVHRIPDDFVPIPFEPPWWGQLSIGTITVPIDPDGKPICLRCNGQKAISREAPPCHRCSGTGEEPNPFGDPS